MANNTNDNERKLDDDFLAKLEDPSTNVKPVTPENTQSETKVKEEPSFEDTMTNLQPREEEKNNNVDKKDDKTDIVVEEKKETVIQEENKSASKPKKSKKTVEVVSSAEYNKDKTPPKKMDNKIDVVDDIDSRVDSSNDLIVNGEEDNRRETVRNELFNESIDSYMHNNYEDEDKKINKKKIEIVSAKNEPEKAEEIKEETKKELTHDEKLKANHIYGGDGKISAFKLRRSKVSKILSKIEVKDTSTIDPININDDIDKLDLYTKTVLPTLNPCYSVVPLVISGVVITMTAFSWPNILDIYRIEEKLDELDPNDEEYIYKKNRLFIEKRHKQLDLFYDHIYSVSGFVGKPSKEELFGKIIKWPDFQQLFFAAYSATFKKAYTFTLTCPRCGLQQDRAIDPKSLCFMLNKNINIDRFNYYLEKGAAIATNDDSMAVYKAFQEEKLVDKSNNTYRTIKPLSDSAIICTLKVPTINEALDGMEQIIETFKDKPLEYIADDGTSIAIDSSFGVNDIKDLRDIKRYLYVKSLLVAKPNESENSDKIEVGYFEFTGKDEIINTISQLSTVDYKELLSDPNLNAISSITGIRHQYDGKLCENDNCKQEMGLMAVEPETLFFTIAEQELPN